jgi:hypothetical protein
MSASLAIEPELLPDAFEPVGPEDDDRAPFGPFRPRDRVPSPPPSRALLARAPRPPRGRARALLPSAPAVFPWLARRFAPGEVTLWCGPRVAVEPLLEMVYVGSALARGRVSLLEGANRFHPYRIGELGRSLGVDAGTTLRRIRLARAFTAHQMVALVEGWAREARRHRPTLLVGHDLPTLFWDGETPDDERDALLRRLARTLAGVLREVDVPLLLTLGPEGTASFPGLTNAGPRWSDYVSFARGPSTLRLRALRDDARLTLVARAPGQLGLEAFGGRSSAGEVIAWGAPPRRTARRSRSD